MSANIEIEKNKFYRIFLVFVGGGRGGGRGWVDIEKVLVSNKISFGEKNCKYFIGYFYNDHKVKQLHIMLTKTSVYVKTKWIYFLIKDDDLLEKYKTIWDKVSADIKK